MRIAGFAQAVDRATIEQHVDLASVPEGQEVRAYVLVHEGESKPHDRDSGNVLNLRWGRAVVRRIAALARRGIQFVRSHTDKTPVGELLGSWTAEVGGRLQAFVAGAFGPEAKGMDVCSIEADGVQWDDSGTVLDVGRLERIALGRSSHDTPGFPGAVLVGSIQCFVDPSATPTGEGEPKRVTIKEVREYLADNPGVRPEQLFRDEQVLQHPAVVSKLKEHTDATSKLNEKISGLEGQIVRRDARDGLTAATKDWTKEAQFHARTAFESWSEPTADPSKLTEWTKDVAARYKEGTGKEVKPDDGQQPKDDGSGRLDTTQPNQPPPSNAGTDPVATAQQALGITTKAA